MEIDASRFNTNEEDDNMSDVVIPENSYKKAAMNTEANENHNEIEGYTLDEQEEEDSMNDDHAVLPTGMNPYNMTSRTNKPMGLRNNQMRNANPGSKIFGR